MASWHKHGVGIALLSLLAAFVALSFGSTIIALDESTEPSSISQGSAWIQSTQEDFQSGDRIGVDTYGIPGSLTLLPLSDNFDSETLNLDRWEVTLSGSAIVTQTAGYLRVANEVWGSHAAGAAVFTGDYLQGDIDIQVDFDLVDWSPTIRNAQAHFTLRDQDLRYFEIKRDGESGLIGLDDGYTVCYGGSGWYSCPAVLNRSDMTGAFRLGRLGDFFTAYYLNGEEWSVLSTSTYYDTPTGVWLKGHNADSNPTYDIRYDNFQVTRNGGVENPTYAFAGTYLSGAYDTGDASYFSTIFWTPHVQPSETGADSLRFQIATNNDNATWDFLGPDGTAETYYTQSGQYIWRGHEGDRYIKLRALFSTEDPDFTPRLDDVTIRFASTSEFRLTRLPFVAEFRTHQDSITSYFDHNFPGEGTMVPQPPDYEIPIYTGEVARRSLGECQNTYGLPIYLSDLDRCVAYDGHNGYDYDLDVGDQIYPAAPGFITTITDTNIDPPWLIKIEHEHDGETFVTWYAHIQPDPEVYEDWLATDPIWRLEVDTSTVIGTVTEDAGHLHFTVKRNGNYTDPYGWLPPTSDPLEAYNGEVSRWLWVHGEPQTVTYDPARETILTSPAGEITAVAKPGTHTEPLTLQIFNSYLGHTGELGGTDIAFTLRAWDSLGNPVTDLERPISITVRYQDSDVSNVSEEALAVYRWEPASASWQILPSQVDQAAKVVVAETNHLSQFALLAERRYTVYLPLVMARQD